MGKKLYKYYILVYRLHLWVFWFIFRDFDNSTNFRAVFESRWLGYDEEDEEDDDGFSAMVGLVSIPHQALSSVTETVTLHTHTHTHTHTPLLTRNIRTDRTTKYSQYLLQYSKNVF